MHPETRKKIEEAERTQATTLDLSNCTDLKDLNALARLTSLKKLNLSWCDSLSDVSVLSGLSGLQHLYLSGCDSLSDVSVLSGLSGLQQLDLRGCSSLSDVSFLSKLTGLQQLDLSGCSSLSDVSVLSGLSGLQHLDLSECSSLSDVSVLSGLSGLQHLYLSGCESLSDVSVLSGLSGLQHLDLSECALLSDVSGLSGLSGLQHLELSGCDSLSDVSGLSGLSSLQHLYLSWCSSLSDVSGLSGLSGLQHLELSGCDSLSDVSGLSGLSGLQHLALSWCKSLSDVSVLSGLSGLQHLYLSGCKSLSDVSVLSQLTGLQQLNLRGCSSLRHIPRAVFELPQLQELKLCETPLLNVPSELLGDHWDFNSLPGIRAYFRALDKGRDTDRDVKVFVLGNGRVGKTSLCRRLMGEDFNPEEESTHGVQFFRLPMPCPEEENNEKKKLFLNLWDFGGQDIYYGTHRMFHHERAVYMIVWEDTDAPFSEDNDGNRYENYPLEYWFSYVQQVAPNAQVVLVQAKCADNLEHCAQKHRTTSLSVRELYCCAQPVANLETLKRELFRAAETILGPEESQAIGASWKEIRQAVHDAVDAGEAPIQERAWFDMLCSKHGLPVEDGGHLLRFLHRQGVLYYDPEHLPHHVVLDQRWACDAVYAILKRDQVPFNRKGIPRCLWGQFTLPELSRYVWSDQGVPYPPETHRTLLDFMQAAEICFELGEEEGSDETVYLAPELLPDEIPQQPVSGWELLEEMPRLFWRYDYTFLSPHVLRGAMVRVGGEYRQCPAYWKNGFYLQLGNSVAKVHAEYGMDESRASGTITIEIRGREPLQLLHVLRKAFEKNYRDYVAQAAHDREKHTCFLGPDCVQLEQGVTCQMALGDASFVDWKTLHGALQGRAEQVQDVTEKFQDVSPFQRVFSGESARGAAHLEEPCTATSGGISGTTLKSAGTYENPPERSGEKVLFSWAHFSDLHYGHGDAYGQTEQMGVMESISRDVERHIPEGLQLDALFFTGDLAQEGTREQLGKGKEWLTSIRDELGIAPEHVFVAPGNHDLIRQNESFMVSTLIKELRSNSPKLSSALVEERSRALLKERFQNFYDHFDDDAVSGRSFNEDTFTTQSILHTDNGQRVAVFVFNTALLCMDDSDLGKLCIGLNAMNALRSHFGKVLKEGGTPPILLCLSHHPFSSEWLCDAREMEEILASHNVLLLCGHIHTTEYTPKERGDGNHYHQLVCNPAHGDTEEPGENGFQFGALVKTKDDKHELRFWRYTVNNTGIRMAPSESSHPRPYTFPSCPGA